MIEIRQTVKAALSVVRWHHVFFVGCLVIPSISLSSETTQPAVAPVAELAAPVGGGSAEGKNVLVEGEVVEVKHYPEVINGVSVYSFVLSDATGDIRVVSPMAALFAVEDIVRIEGIYRGSRSGSLDDAYIDATEGTIEVLEASESSVGKMLRRAPEEMLSVPVSTVSTPWSRSAEVAAVLSAIFALLASTGLLLRFRRFNIGLTLAPRTLDVESVKGKLRVAIRAISTRSQPPQIRPAALLKIPRVGRVRGTLVECEHGAKWSPVLVAIPVFFKETLWLEFPVPGDTKARNLAMAKVVLRDDLCRKRFVVKLSAARNVDLGVKGLAKAGYVRDHAGTLREGVGKQVVAPRPLGRPTALSTLAALIAVLAMAFIALLRETHE